jgi:hypothetical protein
LNQLVGESERMNAYLKANQRTWNTWTRYHLESRFYDLERFKAGEKGHLWRHAPSPHSP